MTREEAARPFMMLSANWPFLKMNEEITFEMWFAPLQDYPVEEVTEGIRRAISEINHTPVVAEVLSYVRNVRDRNRQRMEEVEFNRQRLTGSVNCRKCNDYGFVTIVYPTGYEAVRPCSCQKAELAFGRSFMQKVAEGEPLPEWKQEMLFGRDEIPSQYKLVRVSKTTAETGETFKGMDREMHNRVIWVYGPYIPRQGRDEIILQYQKVRTK